MQIRALSNDRGKSKLRIINISSLLLLAIIVGCHTGAPAGSAPANNEAQANNTNRTATAADANAQSMGTPGTQPAQSQQQGNSSQDSTQTAGQSAGTGPVLSTRPAAGTVANQAIDVPAGTVLKIRLNETLNVKRTQTGQSFTGSVVDAVDVNGSTAISRGASVTGVVDRSHRRGHFKGASVLELRLTSLDQNGQHYRIDTRDVVRTKKGKGKRSAAFIGGGAGLGMLIGGVATGGVGLLVGGLAGGGAGTLGAAFTGNRDITIPAESVLSFRLADPIQIHP